MAALVIKSLPETLHRKLKEEAGRHHRSMTKEALCILEEKLASPASGAPSTPPRLPRPHRGKFPLTDALIRRWKREGMA